MNSKQQGDIGVAMAIAYYTRHEYAVSIPMGDNTLYDLVVDKTGLLRVQVKTTSYKRGNGYIVQLATSGGNRSWNGKPKKLSSDNSDLVFVYALDGSIWEIPSVDVDNGTSINLGPSKDKYRIYL